MNYEASLNFNRRHKFRAGMGLIEIMLALVICTLLLVACATAFTASSAAISNNDQFFRCTQAARVTLGQILAEIRNCDTLDMSTANTIKIIRATQSSTGGFTQEYVLAANEVSRSFVYDSTRKRITMQISYTGGSTSPVYELTSNVTACSFGPADTGTSYSGGSMPVHVPITLTVSTGKNSVTLCGCAVPRREARY